MTTMTYPDIAPAFAAPRVSRAALWTSRVLFTLAVLFLLFDLTMKFLVTPESVEGTKALGWPQGAVQPLGIIQGICIALLLIPRTAPFGALLLTGYLGGAVAAHVRVQNPLFSHILSPVYVAVCIWLPLYLRDPRVRGVLRSGDAWWKAPAMARRR
jgi:hypothetical protein